ncbi:hypothetical protein HDV06_005143 [Boothiomyces sp. JEL0866]|nr:hypothetical protein HDV06_005143 [Boothiomyces sp. JEL0866]
MDTLDFYVKDQEVLTILHNGAMKDFLLCDIVQYSFIESSSCITLTVNEDGEQKAFPLFRVLQSSISDQRADRQPAFTDSSLSRQKINANLVSQPAAFYIETEGTIPIETQIVVDDNSSVNSDFEPLAMLRSSSKPDIDSVGLMRANSKAGKDTLGLFRSNSKIGAGLKKHTSMIEINRNSRVVRPLSPQELKAKSNSTLHRMTSFFKKFNISIDDEKKGDDEMDRSFASDKPLFPTRIQRLLKQDKNRKLKTRTISLQDMSVYNHDVQSIEKKSSSSSNLSESPTPPRNTNIVVKDEEANVVLVKSPRDAKNVPLAGTLSQLIQTLAEEPLSYFADVFVLTVHDFSSIEELLEAIYEYFCTLKLKEDPQNKVYMHRLLTIVKRLGTTFPGTFSQQQIKESAISLITEVAAYFNSDYVDQFVESMSVCGNPELNLPNHEQLLDIISVPTEKIAKQMIMIDFALFRAIQPNEFVTLFNKNIPQLEDINISRFIARTNQISKWATSLILSCKSYEDRVQALEKLIFIAKKCLDFKNFNTSMAIICGINNPNVIRLKKTFNCLSANTKIQLNLLEAFFDSRNNFGHYRTTLANTPRACVPLIMLITKDVYQIKQLNPALLPNGLINFSRETELYRIISPILHIQSFCYSFQHIFCPLRGDIATDLASYLTTLTILEHAKIENESLSLERDIAKRQAISVYSETPDGVSTKDSNSIERQKERGDSACDVNAQQ